MSGLLGRWRSWLVGVGAHSNEVKPVNETTLPVWRAPTGPMERSRNPQKQANRPTGATSRSWGCGSRPGLRAWGGGVTVFDSRYLQWGRLVDMESL